MSNAVKVGYRYSIVEGGCLLIGRVVEIQDNPTRYVVQWNDETITVEDSCDGNKIK